MTNRISAEFTVQSQTEVAKSIDTIRQELGFLATIRPGDRRSKQNMGQFGLGYARECLTAAKTHPEMLPGTFDIPEFEKDVNLYGSLQACYIELNSLQQRISDTLNVLGQEMMEQSNLVYNQTKIAAKTDNRYTPTRDRLSERYIRKAGRSDGNGNTDAGLKKV